MARRIAVVIDPWDYPYNGTVVSTRRFVKALESRNYEFELLSIGPQAGSGAGFRQLSIPGFNRVIDRMRAPLARPDRQLLRERLAGCELLHIQYPFFLAYAALEEARKLGIPVVSSFHVQPENILQNIRLPSRALSGLLYRLFIRWIYNRADRVIAPSQFAARLLTEHGLRSPVTVVSNGIPARFFGVTRRPRGSGYRLLSVGRLAREKQQETLLHAIALSRHRAEIELTLAGVGPRESYLKRLAADLGIRAEIGWIEDDVLLERYGSADLFVHTGSIELEGMSVLEAMAAGNAVVVSDSKASACAAMIREGSARFRKGDAADLAEKIDCWLDDAPRREAQGQHNRSEVLGLTHDRAVADIAAVYDRMLGAMSPGEFTAQLTGTS